MEELTILAALGLVALGFCASGYGVLIGSGGGFIVAPLLIILFGMDHNIAVGTSLFTVALASISGSISYLYLKRVDLRSAFLFSLAAIPGALLGILGLKAVTEGPFEVIFGSFLSLLGLYVMLRPEYKAKPPPEGVVRGIRRPGPARAFGASMRRIKTTNLGTFRYMYNEPGAVATNGLFGFLSSFFGMGGGPVRTPMLVYLFRFPGNHRHGHVGVHPGHLHQHRYGGARHRRQRGGCAGAADRRGRGYGSAGGGVRVEVL